LPAARGRSPVAWRLVWIASVCASALAAALVTRGVLSRPVPTFQRLAFRRGMVTAARFAPDDRTVIYSATWDGEPQELFTTRVESPESKSLGLGSTQLYSVSSRGELAVAVGRSR